MQAPVGGRAVRVHLSIDADELPREAAAVRAVLAAQHLVVMDRDMRAADLFVGVYGDRYGVIDSEVGLSVLEADYLAAGSRPRLVYVMPGRGDRDAHLALLLSRIQADDLTSYRRVSDATELAELVADDVAMVLMEAFTGEIPVVRVDEPPVGVEAPRPGPRSRVPAPWHRLVGRSVEADAVCRMITGDTRLLTLTGPGCIGKSRLAIEVASRCQSDFRHGAWFVDLSGIRDPSLVAPTIAHALGVREAAGALPVESLKTYLASMHALVLLDSFEMVTAAAPLVVDLLASAPDVSFFITSRSVLRVRGEQEYPLPPLAVPPPGSSDLTAALELFLERAEAANPTRVLTADDRAAAAEICRRLDGVPLALELAAARTRLLSPTALLGKLASALDVLGNGPFDLPERQRALRSTLDWDHALLGEDEKLVFRRLAVFPRQVTLPAAEAVVDEPGLDVVDGLDGLAGKSLVRSTEPVPVTGEPTFVMLQTVREYAHEQLEAAGEADEIHRRHAHYVLARVELAMASAPGELEGWLSVLEHDHPDIRVALDWADRALEVDVLLRLAAGLGTFWRSHCHFSEGRRWLDRALSLSGGQRTHLRADLLNAAGYLSRARGDYEVADAQYREGLAIREELGDRAKVASSLRFVGNVAFDRGDLQTAEQWWERSLEALDGIDDDVRRVSVINNLGVAAHHRGDDALAIRRYDETCEIGARIGSRELQARALMNKGQALATLGRVAEGRDAAREAVRIYADLDDTWDLVDALDILAGAIGRSGDPVDVELAGWLFGAAAGLRDALAVRRPLTEQRDYDVARDCARTADPDAFDRGAAAGRAATLRQVVDRALGEDGAP
jgi:predicted ATPase